MNLMLRDSKGNRLFRKVEITIYFPENMFPPKKMSQHANAHQGFGPDGIDDLLMQTADQLEQLYPWWEFKYIALTPVGRTARFVFTFAGYSAKAKLDIAATGAVNLAKPMEAPSGS